MKSRMFYPRFQEYAQVQVYPQRAESTRIGISRQRGTFWTAIPNAILGWKGYMPLIRPLNADLLWSKASLKDWDVDEDINPFELSDDHPATVLRCTCTAVHNFITRPSIHPIDAGIRLSQLWKSTMIRRSIAS